MRVAFRDVGFSEKYVTLRVKCSHGEGKIGQWYQERLIHHRMVLDGGYKKELAELTDNGVNLSVLRGLAYASLISDLEDPDTAREIPFRDRQRLYVEITKMEADAHGDAKTQGHFTQNNVLAIIGSKINDPLVRAELADGVSAALGAATDEVENIIEAAHVYEA